MIDMNVRKMRQIGKDILAEPRRFNMTRWASRILDEQDAKIHDHSLTNLPPCGTVCCFAGSWALRYAKVSPEELRRNPYECVDGKGVDVLAELDLDLPNDTLFFADRWPLEVQNHRLKAGTRKYAEHFVNVVLESYIRTNGWENEKA